MDVDEFPSEDWPLFYLLGAQKAGTTSLAMVLGHHPQLCTPSVPAGCPSFYAKEPHFWSKEVYNTHGVGHFLHRYHESSDCRRKRRAQRKVLGMDATPTLSKLESISRIAQHYPPNLQKQLRFIAVLREPIERDLSWFNHEVHLHKVGVRRGERDPRTTRPTPAGYAAWVEVHHRRVDADAFKGRYDEHLMHLWAHFPRNQTMVIQMDTLFSDVSGTLNRIANFLGIDYAPLASRVKLPKANGAGKDSLDIEEVAPSQCALVRAFYANSTARLYRLLEENPGPPEQPPFPPFREPECGTKHVA